MSDYTDLALEAVPDLPHLTVLEFGTDWCGICRATAPRIRAGLEGTSIHHLKVEDGPGRPLGRSLGVKLWPTLVFLRDGVEVTRLVRPTRPDEVAAAAAQLTGEP